MQQAHLSKLVAPNEEDLASLRSWLQRPGYGNNFLTGKIEDVWDAEKGHNDFASIGRRTGENNLVSRAIARVVPYLQRTALETAGRGSDGKIYTFAGSILSAVAITLTAVLASILPTLPIIVLYLLKGTALRLGMMVVFTALLAMALVICTKARPVEIFCATTAFAAVMVVFVGSVSHD